MNENENLKTNEWEKAYSNKNNFVFYPQEEVIRFTSKYIRKRVGINDFLDFHNLNSNPKVLDLGCGIGRHIVYLFEMGLEPYGIDLSSYAINTAIKLAKSKGFNNISERVTNGDIRKLPWEDNFFDFIMSVGVLDSMQFDIAKSAIKESERVLSNKGLFYLDLISGDNSEFYKEFSGELLVTGKHEKGTIQSYFNMEKLNDLIKDTHFKLIECKHIKNENCLGKGYHSRYHLVLLKDYS